jgi:hypothetical protein
MFSIIYMLRGTFAAHVERYICSTVFFFNESEAKTQNLSSCMFKRTRSSNAPYIRDSNPAKTQFS